MRTPDFDYPLPPELIADHPLPERTASRMMVVHRDSGLIEHRVFRDLPDFISPGDLLVLNDTKVVPARFFSDDGSIELVRVGMPGESVWKCLVRPGRKMKVGRTVRIGASVGTVIRIDEEGYRFIRWDAPVDDDKYGRLALPHYMKRETDPTDRERYQTVYAVHEGAIAAPTAGLHFSRELLASLPHRFLTLHVGVGTFRPVKVERVEEHHMHTESFDLPPDTADAVNSAKRVFAVGTTTVRVLETQAARYGLPLRPGSGETDIFIYPGFHYQVTDALLTNFHLPQSTLIMLVCAFASRPLIMEAYRQAVAERYRFFSYGDCMLIL